VGFFLDQPRLQEKKGFALYFLWGMGDNWMESPPPPECILWHARCGPSTLFFVLLPSIFSLEVLSDFALPTVGFKSLYNSIAHIYDGKIKKLIFCRERAIPYFIRWEAVKIDWRAFMWSGERGFILKIASTYTDARIFYLVIARSVFCAEAT
jgi:hypothetical protein